MPASARADSFERSRRDYDLRLEPDRFTLTPAVVRALGPWLDLPVALGGETLANALEVVGFHRP
jgi:hypothetical protein